jgi:hypothetical protein
MNHKSIFLGNTVLYPESAEVTGQFVEIEGEMFYKISHYNQMPDFFMSIVSHSDHWMFISSNGSLSAGRKNRDNALFPYYSSDKIADYKNLTGSKTYILVTKQGKTFLWEPFTDESEKVYRTERNLYKSLYGNKILFEEINKDLSAGFTYGWYNSEKFGFIKKSTLEYKGDGPVKIELLDGIRNILPSGIDYAFQNEYSNLLDAYKKSELLKESGLGLFMLSSVPVDRAEPSESLKTTTVWSQGLSPEKKIVISDRQTGNFKRGLPVETEYDVRASRGAYFVCDTFEFQDKAKEEWFLAAEINQDSSAVANLDHYILSGKNLKEQVENDILAGTVHLKKTVSKADGVQTGNEMLSCARHFSNTLFNVMRGGIFPDNYRIDTNNFQNFAAKTNKQVYTEYRHWFDQLPQQIEYPELLRLAVAADDPILERICYEYLPLTFSRRHGDPSRPWNRFSIETKNSDGTAKLGYEGNWRDIFQNWEALALSYPGFIEGMISKFLNASTADGYNPYRITSEGIDWETPDPHDPWAYIGYWGDHQIIYLQKLLELSEKYHPGKLETLMARDIFVYANVPYRIKPFGDMILNPQETIDFDHALNKKIELLTGQSGSDGRLLHSEAGTICRSNLTEKILTTLLAKLGNFIPGAGIWLNTQRPEWNDANNALVGNGVSMVTLFYLRRFLSFWEDMFGQTNLKEVAISEELKQLFDKTTAVFESDLPRLETGFDDESRYSFVSRLGIAGSEYRKTIYENAFSGQREAVSVAKLKDFIRLALKYTDHSIRINKREDGLYHAYNLITLSENRISVRRLYEMLEGQVAVLSSGFLSVDESLDLVDALKASRLFRPDQYSYLLYPDRQLPRFTEKNNIPESLVKESGLLSRLTDDNDSSVICKDNTGRYHFNGTFRNAKLLAAALTKLDPEKYGGLVEDESAKILDIYESIFDHKSFTGRSGTFYGYEGLGSIYWHMVSKLMLAVQEIYFRGVREKADTAILNRLKEHYYEIKAGIGLYKSPRLYGAFPTDPYSHTPQNAGAQQPGMTGQVKEDYIARMAELGVHVNEGKISFNTSLLNRNEMLTSGTRFEFFDVNGEKRHLELTSGQLGFTICQVPVIYSSSDKNQVRVTLKAGGKEILSGKELTARISDSVFNRTGEVEKIEVEFTSDN